MWTSRDKWHAHALMGAASLVAGGYLCVAWGYADAAALLGSSSAPLGAEPASVAAEAPLALVSLGAGLACGAAGLPLATTARKLELSARSLALLVALTAEGARLLPGGAGGFFELLDAALPALAAVPLLWQCAASAWILANADNTGDDRRAAIGILVGVGALGLQLLPIAHAASSAGLTGGLAGVWASRPGLAATWLHGSVSAAAVVGWSTLGASARARGVVDDAAFLDAFIVKPAMGWLALFALDCAAHAPWASPQEYLATAAGALL